MKRDISPVFWTPLAALPLLVGALFAGCSTTGGRRSRVLFEDRVERIAPETVGVPVTNEASGEVGYESRTSGPQESPLPRISGRIALLDAVNIALAQNLSLRAAFLQREEARGAVVEARAAAFPSVSLGASAETDLADRGDNPEDYAVTWSITQPLWRSGAVSAGLRYAKLYAESTDEAIRAAVQETVEAVARDYLSVLLARQMVDVYENSVGVAERMLDTAKKKRRAGTASDYEVLRAEVEVASTRAALIQERNRLRTAGVALLQTLGVNQESDVTLVGALVYRPATNDLSALLRDAMLHRPDLLQAEAAVKMAEENLKVVRSSYGPSADVFVSGRYANPDPNDRSNDSWNDDWGAGVSVSYALFDGLARKGRMAQAQSKLRQAKAKLLAAEEAARVELIRAVLDVENAEELYISQAKNIDLSKEALRMLENGFKVGKNTQIEVLDARSALTEAVGQYYNAIYAHTVARLAVRRAAGTLGVDATREVLPDLRLEASPLDE